MIKLPISPAASNAPPIGKTLARLTICIVAVTAVTAILYALAVYDRPLFPALTFLFVILVVSAFWDFRYSVFVSFLAGLGFLWLLPPIGQFWLDDPRDVFALITFVGIGIITGRLSQRARRSEGELRDVIETMPAMAWTALPDGSNTFVSRRWTEYTGLSVEQSQGPGWQAAMHPQDLDRYVEAWRAACAGGQPFERQARFRRAADGAYRWFLVRAVPLPDDHGTILKWYGILTDIEDRKRAEALLTGEKRILEMVAKGDSLAQILDSLCRLVEEQGGGVLASILLLEGNRLRHGGAPSLPKAYTDAIDGAAIGPAAGSCGTAAYRGEQVIVEDIATDPLWADYRDAALPHSLRACWSTPVFSSHRKVIATFAMYYREPLRPGLRDQETIEQITHLAGIATETRLTQEALRRSEAYLAEAQRLAHTGSWACNPETSTAAYWSEENFRIWGFDPRPQPPDREALRQRMPPPDRDRLAAASEKALRERTDYSCEFRIVLPGGAVRHIRSVAHPVFSASGELVEVVGTDVDVTEIKHAEEERERLRQLEAELAYVSRVNTMGELAGSLAHEIKHPIAAAAMNAETCARWLRRDAPDLTKACDAAGRVVADVMRAADIIERVRSLFRRDSPEREPVDLNAIIQEMVVLLRDTANRSSISIRTELDAGLPKARADRVQLQQVVMNLMLNGIEAMKDNGGELTVTSNGTADGQLLISVRDLGVGLPVEQTASIFEAFFTTKPHGTGMGLSISQRIIESHGGRLWASAPTGRGATLQFMLPGEVTAYRATDSFD